MGPLGSGLTGLGNVLTAGEPPAGGAGVPLETVIAINNSGNVQNLQLTPLDGNTDGNWKIRGSILVRSGLGTVNLYLRPISPSNDTSLHTLSEFNNGSGVYVANTSASPTPGWFIGQSGGGDEIIFWADISTVSGRTRTIKAFSTSTSSSATVITLKTQGWCTDLVTNFTQLTLHADVAASIQDGTYYTLTKERETL